MIDFKDIKDVKALAKILTDSGLTALEIDEGGSKIRLERTVTTVATASVAETTFTAPPEKPIKSAQKSVDGSTIDFNKIIEVTSPMIGIFYAAASPSSEPFVSIGSRVKKGDILCIIEAMKVMNEIISDRDGEIVDVCVSNGQVVEFSQVLFKIF